VSTNGAGVNKIASATIADLTAGSGGNGYPFTQVSSAGAEVSRLCALGEGGMVASSNYDAARIATSYVLRTHDASESSLDKILLGEDTAALSGQFISWNDMCAYDMVFDGLNLWAFHSVIRDSVNTPANMSVVLKIDVSKLAGVSTVDRHMRIGDISSVYFMDSGTQDAFSTTKYKYCSMSFDGRDVWCVLDPASGNTNSGKIFRLPLALLRS